MYVLAPPTREGSPLYVLIYSANAEQILGLFIKLAVDYIQISGTIKPPLYFMCG